MDSSIGEFDLGELDGLVVVEAVDDAEAVAEMNLDPAQVDAQVQSAIDETNKDLARVRQIKKFTVLEDPLSIERGELTPTLKVKRNVVRDHFAAEIDAMYG